MQPDLKVRVDRIAPEGEGIGKSPGSDKVIFVPYGIPGDELMVAQAENKPRYVRGRVLSVEKPSPDRISPRCLVHFAPGKTEYCGGCDWQHASYAAQLRYKREIVADCMRRIAKLNAPIADTLASPSEWRYRNKVQVPFQPAPGRAKAGFYMPGSHRVIEFEDCVVQPELSVEIVRTVRELSQTRGWRAYDETQDKGWLRHLFIRTNAAGEAAVVFVTRDRAFPREREAIEEIRKRHPRVVSLFQNVQEERTAVILGPRWRKLWGKDRLSEKIGPFTLEFSPGAFVQVNTPAAEVLYGAAERQLYDDGFRPNLVLDLYSGVGAIAFWIAKGAGRVIGVEEVPQAVEDAYANARRLGVRNVSFVKGTVEHALKRLRGLENPRPWAAVVDPPRGGCEKDVLKFLSTRRVERVVYVSCNPATFARDARVLADAGYRLEKIQPVDLFPQTAHVELVARFNA
ncbi:MAG: 23S rRNA (uracil(1939)-C(5))-methyltransferase RlmD [Elusimicrobia bacterium]|nr:23S rRNA (uracil(1939)-C(5))-methyltransferase RlmD [Elusimicrobiota bacterium]